jgi:hypothetical protein
MSIPPIRLDVVDDVFWLRFSDHIRSLRRNSLFSLIGPPGIGREFRGDQFKMRERIKRSGREYVTLREGPSGSHAIFRMLVRVQKAGKLKLCPSPAIRRRNFRAHVHRIALPLR